jgi:hypothetical protein
MKAQKVKNANEILISGDTLFRDIECPYVSISKQKQKKGVMMH